MNPILKVINHITTLERAVNLAEKTLAKDKELSFANLLPRWAVEQASGGMRPEKYFRFYYRKDTAVIDAKLASIKAGIPAKEVRIARIRAKVNRLCEKHNLPNWRI